MDDENLKTYADRKVWLRGLYMLIFLFFMGVAKFVAFAVIIFLFLTVLFTAETNQKLVKFGQSLSTYQYQVMMFLTYNSEKHPFPMDEWPDGSRHSDISNIQET
ncbi:MAG: DUF4389 domain-containing protein [Thiohalomonadales bacterium]